MAFVAVGCWGAVVLLFACCGDATPVGKERAPVLRLKGSSAFGSPLVWSAKCGATGVSHVFTPSVKAFYFRRLKSWILNSASHQSVSNLARRLRPLRSEISSQRSSWMEALASSRGLLFHLRREGLATLSERLFVGPCREHESARTRAGSSFSSWEKESRPPRSEI